MKQKSNLTPRFLVGITGAIPLVVGLVVMIGWFSHHFALIQINESFAPMQYNTALGFVVTGLALLALARSYFRVAVGLATFVLTLAFFTLLEYLLGADFGIDQVLMESYVLVGTSSPGRMAPNTALCFMIVGAGVILSEGLFSGYKSWVNGVAGALVLSIGLIGLLGYVLGLEAAYGWRTMTRMALHTAICFVTIGAGLVGYAISMALAEDEDVLGWIANGIWIIAVILAVCLWLAARFSPEQTVQGLVNNIAILLGGVLLIFAWMLNLVLRMFRKLRGQIKLTKQAYRRIRAESTARASAESQEIALGGIVERSRNEIYIFSGDALQFRYVNLAALTNTGYSREELLKFTLLDIAPSLTRQSLEELLLPLVEKRQETVLLETMHRRKDGTTYDVEVNVQLTTYRTAPAFVAIIMDVSERTRAEKALRETIERLSVREKISHIFSTVSDDQMYGDVLQVVQEQLRSPQGVFGYLDEKGALVVPSMTRAIWDECQVSDKRTKFERDTWCDSAWPVAIREKKTVYANTPSSSIPEGHLPVFRHISMPILYKDEVIGLLQVINKAADYDEQDIGNLKLIADQVAPILEARLTRDRNKKAMIESEKNLLRAQQISHVGSWNIDLSDNRISWGEETCRIFKQPLGTTVSYDTFIEMVHPEDRSLVDKAWQAALQDNVYDIEHRIIIDSEIRWVRERAVLEYDDGKPFSATGTAQDITEVKQAQELNKNLSQQLLQAQKMEAVGQLTGGIAHDFNNILAIVLGNLDFLKAPLQADERASQHLGKAISNLQRGVALIKRLLSFSRKQMLTPAVVDLNHLLQGMDELLRSTLSEAIEVDIVSGAGLWPCFADPSELENCLLNLALNARDAMPDGGKLTIETGNTSISQDYASGYFGLAPGDYVMLVVSDTGIGIPKENQPHVFEPFFTTKTQAKGSGLGLSMVYGFVKQSGGHILIYSEESEGTSVKIYLPRSDKPQQNEEDAQSNSEIVGGRNERVLLVEDEPDLLEILVEQLQNLDYQVLAASDATSAMAIVQNNDQIELLLTDVILPGGMNGEAIAQALKQQIPGLKVLYMSGYTKDAMIQKGRLDQGVQLLRKPFSHKDLAQAIRAVLDQ